VEVPRSATVNSSEGYGSAHERTDAVVHERSSGRLGVVGPFGPTSAQPDEITASAPSNATARRGLTCTITDCDIRNPRSPLSCPGTAPIRRNFTLRRLRT
jgi:hypothetical protein